MIIALMYKWALCLLLFKRQNGVFRAYLRTDRTAGAQQRIDFDPVVPDVESRTSQVVHAVPVVLALGRHLKGFALGQFYGFGVQCTGLFGDNNRDTLEPNGFANRFDTLFDFVWFYDRHVRNADRSDDRLYRHLGVAIHIQLLHINPRVGLMSGHCGRTVVQNDECEIMVVEHAADQAGNSGMKKGGIADERDDFLIRCR